MPKYYTPTKDEFHDGFSFEGKINDETEFSNCIFDIELKDTHIEKSRVKYLDVEDIKSLGFTIKGEHNNEILLFKNVFNNQPFYYTILFTEENNMPFIKIDDMYNHPIMAKVHIKNKSELEWLLNRYGIL